MKYIAYTDGSFMEINNRQAYGSAAIFRQETENSWIVLSKAGDDDVLLPYRNVAGEILAVLQLCSYLLKNFPDCSDLTIIYDYAGIENWVTGAWKAKKDLTQHYRDYMHDVVMQHIHINFKHTKGHSGDEGNELVDMIANRSVQEYLNG